MNHIQKRFSILKTIGSAFFFGRMIEVVLLVENCDDCFFDFRSRFEGTIG